jgi:hypothetical protein
MASNAQLCYNTGTTTNVNYNSVPSIIIGSFVYANSPDFKTFGCFEITDVDATGSTVYAQSIYTDCYDCLNNNYGTVTFDSCDGTIKSVEVPISELGYLPIVNDSFYGTVDVNDGEGGEIQRVTTCWQVGSIQQYGNEEAYNRRIFSSIVGEVTSYEGRSGCEDCFLANATTYEVIRCNEENSDYVLLLPGYSGNTISYTDGTNIYCGVVNDQAIGTPEWTFVSDYGNPGEGGNFCEDCLATENQKILLESCTDPRNQLVVWASTLFGIGDYSHLSTDDGCFRVVGPTTEEISSPYFLNFVPSPGCDPCIECNGVAYEYSTCSEEPITGTVYLYQYLPSGTTYFDPYQQVCTTIGNITTGGDYTLYSVNTFNDCPDCVDYNANIELWYGTICETGQDIYVTTVSSAGLATGNVVKAMWGSNEYVCVQLDSTVPGTDSSTWYDTKKDSLGNTELYDGCGTCLGNSNITVGLINCDTDEESYVTISLSNYLSIIGNGFTLPNYTIRDQRQNCYTITSVCPQPSSASTESMSVAYFFYSCQYCPDINQPRSANTEYNACVICCDCGSTGSTVNSVSTPHPIYTDGYNNPIMQLNMVVLGGPNGLNS